MNDFVVIRVYYKLDPNGPWFGPFDDREQAKKDICNKISSTEDVLIDVHFRTDYIDQAERVVPVMIEKSK